MKSNHSRSRLHAILCAVTLAGAITATGCQVGVSGQTLPSPYYMHDDVQYFPAGPEFKLTKEANLLKARAAERELQ